MDVNLAPMAMTGQGALGAGRDFRAAIAEGGFEAQAAAHLNHLRVERCSERDAVPGAAIEACAADLQRSQIRFQILTSEPPAGG